MFRSSNKILWHCPFKKSRIVHVLGHCWPQQLGMYLLSCTYATMSTSAPISGPKCGASSKNLQENSLRSDRSGPPQPRGTLRSPPRVLLNGKSKFKRKKSSWRNSSTAGAPTRHAGPSCHAPSCLRWPTSTQQWGPGVNYIEYRAMPSLRDVSHDCVLCTFSIRSDPDRGKWCGSTGQAAWTCPSHKKSHPLGSLSRRVGPAL